MFDAIRNLFDEMRGGAPAREFAADDYRIAAAALLVHLGHADGELDAAERRYLQRIAQESFGLDPQAARRLVAHAEQAERQSIDLYQFTSVLKRALDEDGRRTIVELLWQMAYSDGDAHEFEENLVWRVAELLGVSSSDRLALRRRIRDGET